MIIGIDASRANVKEKTGTEWYAYYLIKELFKIADPNDQFILYSKEPLTDELSKLPPNFINKILKWSPGILWTQIRLAWEILFHKPNILFIPAHTIPIICPKKTYTTIHDVGFEKFEKLYSKKSIGFKNKILNNILKLLVLIFSLGKYRNTELDYHRWSCRIALKKARRIITVSSFSKNGIINSFQVNQEKIKVVYNAYNPAYNEQITNDQIYNIKQKYKLSEPYFIYIGRLEEKKNTLGLIRGFHMFLQKNKSNHKLVLIGSPGYGYEAIIKEIKNRDLEEKIIMPGWINENDLPPLLKGAKIFIFPSLYEGFGMPILEAMAVETPVITSNFGAMKEIAGDAAILADSHNSEEIAKAISKLINNTRLSQKIIERGQNRKESFSWKKTAIKTLQIIKGEN